MKSISATRVAYTDGIYLDKSCDKHGFFSTLIWEGSEQSYSMWDRPNEQHDKILNPLPAHNGCPFDCGLCEEHHRAICCALLEVTSRCNLRCPVCFASAGTDSPDPTLAQLDSQFSKLMRAGGKCNVQLSGGEPTMRDDLAEIIKLGSKHGFTFFQLNTNGLRLASDKAYLNQLVDAGLSCVFLQFDALRDEVYESLRGKKLLSQKLKAIDNCAAAGVGVVLVPTVVCGVNDGDLGKIISFAIDRLPFVRGVHFQPASTFGRYELGGRRDGYRLTIPRILSLIEEQTNGRLHASDFLSGGAENSYCSFHANFTVQKNGEISALRPQHGERSCCCSSASSRDSVARRFTIRRSAPLTLRTSGGTISDSPVASLDDFLERVENRTLAVSGMLFQDGYTFDVDRVRDCYICEVSRDGRTIPFCAYNLTDNSGRYLYREL
ncbi:MAG: radical SAM protein [Oscillospiraceae bacterium]